jgi:hypothetical protein
MLGGMLAGMNKTTWNSWIARRLELSLYSSLMYRDPFFRFGKMTLFLTASKE